MDVQAIANNLTIDHLGIANITIKWGDVPELDRQGIIRGYKIFCYDHNTKTLVEEKTFNETGASHVIMFENLVYYSDYLIDILAFTSKGDGVPYQQNDWMPVRTEGSRKSLLSFFHPVRVIFKGITLPCLIIRGSNRQGVDTPVEKS